VLAEWLLGERGDIDLSNTEEPVGTNWTVTIVGAD